MIILIAALIVAGAVAWAGARIAPGAARSSEAVPSHTAEMFALFAPAIAQAANDPRLFVTWQPLALAARRLFPAEFTALDAAAGGTFPFTSEQIQAAHARWSAEWLAWERAHDGEFKLKAAAAHEELGDRAGTPYGRARLDAIEREKLERYQHRYEEYTRVSKALHALLTAASPSPG